MSFQPTCLSTDRVSSSNKPGVLKRSLSALMSLTIASTLWLSVPGTAQAGWCDNCYTNIDGGSGSGSSGGSSAADGTGTLGGSYHDWSEDPGWEAGHADDDGGIGAKGNSQVGDNMGNGGDGRARSAAPSTPMIAISSIRTAL